MSSSPHAGLKLCHRGREKSRCRNVLHFSSCCGFWVYIFPPPQSGWGPSSLHYLFTVGFLLFFLWLLISSGFFINTVKVSGVSPQRNALRLFRKRTSKPAIRTSCSLWCHNNAVSKPLPSRHLDCCEPVKKKIFFFWFLNHKCVFLPISKDEKSLK